jgi:hypothetical protein
MKKNKVLISFLLVFCSAYANTLKAQDETGKSEEMVKLKYYNYNNNIQYVIIENMLNKDKKITPISNNLFEIYLDSNKIGNFIALLKTDVEGKAKAFLPPNLKKQWESKSVHKFIVLSPVHKNEISAEAEVVKAKILVDTSYEEGVRKISVSLLNNENKIDFPTKDVEIKIGVQRLGGLLSAGDADSYTTDSLGRIIVDYNKVNLPGNQRGDIVLAAKMEDNDTYGNILVEKIVPWGAVVKEDNSFFDKRTLWTTHFRTPYWLLAMAYSIIIGVWSTIFYLLYQIYKIKKSF